MSRHFLFAFVSISISIFAVHADEVVGLFQDKGSTFIRAGSGKGLAVGNEVSLYLDVKGEKAAGKGTVMEVWAAMARLGPLEGPSAKAKFAGITSKNDVTPPLTVATAVVQSPSPPAALTVNTIVGRAEKR